MKLVSQHVGELGSFSSLCSLEWLLASPSFYCDVLQVIRVSKKFVLVVIFRGVKEVFPSWFGIAIVFCLVLFLHVILGADCAPKSTSFNDTLPLYLAVSCCRE